jgi:prepilin peptidase CpaA
LGLTWASVCDLWRRRIPNAATGLVLFSGLLVRGLDEGWIGVASGLGAAVLVVLALYRPWNRGGIGGGDVKLAAATGAWVGVGTKLVWFSLAAAFAGGIVSLVCYLLARSPARAEMRANVTLAVLHQELPTVPSHRKGFVSVPYALAIAAGAVAAFFGV